MPQTWNDRALSWQTWDGTNHPWKDPAMAWNNSHLPWKDIHPSSDLLLRDGSSYFLLRDASSSLVLGY